MLIEIKQIPSKRPSRWNVRTIYVLRCDQCDIQYEKSYTNKSIVSSYHFCSKPCKYQSQSDGVLSKNVANPWTVEKVKQKIRKTNLERYGVEYSSQSPIIKNRIKETCLLRFGSLNPMGSYDVQQKSIKTCQEKYGTEHASQADVIKEKIRQTNVEKYGAPCVLRSQVIIDKIKKTNFDRLDYENPLMSPQVREKAKQTTLARYGAEHISQVPEFHEKMMKTSKSNHETGHFVGTLGTFWFRSSWERMFLEWCDLNCSEIQPNIPISYEFDGKHHVYYADFKVIVCGKEFLCEVKPLSLWKLPQNIAKRSAAESWSDAHKMKFIAIDIKDLSNLACLFV